MSITGDKLLFIAHVARNYRNEFDESETLETAISDMIADILHYSDTLRNNEREVDNHPIKIGVTVADKALYHYTEEIEQED